MLVTAFSAAAHPGLSRAQTALHGCLAPEQDVEPREYGFNATSTSPWLRLEIADHVLSHGWIRILSTPQQKCIGWPEQKYINDAGEQGPELGAFVRHQTWAGLSAGVSELARRERLLL